MFKKCDNCKKEKLWFLVKQRTVYIPAIQKRALSQVEVCGTCVDRLQVELDKQIINNVMES